MPLGSFSQCIISESTQYPFIPSCVMVTFSSWLRWFLSSFPLQSYDNYLVLVKKYFSHGRRSLVGCSLWGREESDTTEWLHFHFSLSWIGEGNGNPLQCSCLENPRDRGAWWAAVYGVAQSWTRLKRFSSSNSSSSSSLYSTKKEIFHPIIYVFLSVKPLGFLFYSKVVTHYCLYLCQSSNF